MENRRYIEYPKYNVNKRELNALEDFKYSSNNSSPETDKPRRKLDIKLLDIINIDLRSKVKYLRSKLLGYPI